jgi:hypothetical protein
LLVILSEASNASAEKDLGQLRVSEAGTGFEIAKRSFADFGAHASPDFHRMQQLETGTGGACTPLSEILPSARVARFVRMTPKEIRRPLV